MANKPKACPKRSPSLRGDAALDELMPNTIGSELCTGWEVVCPDGKVRHFPYHNQGDAACDADVYSSRGCRGNFRRPNVLQRRQEPCPEGRHRVRPISFLHGATRSAEA